VLYGFARERDRDLFRSLLKVSGVGAKMGLAILSGMDAERFVRCVEQEDIQALKRLPGIGAKTAQRLVVEMRDRLGALGVGVASLGDQRTAGIPSGEERDQALTDAVSALVALGYRPVDANRMVRAVDDGAKTSEQIIRAALRAAG
jgi:Holliday junction DNA helicase RuvA